MSQLPADEGQACLLHQPVYPRTQYPLSIDRQQSIFAVYDGIEPPSPPLRGGILRISHMSYQIVCILLKTHSLIFRVSTLRM